MALQLWMPLMGDLHNQGLSDYSISTLGTLSWVSGKLGAQALKAGDGTQIVNGIRIEDNFTELLNEDYSVSVWVKPYGQHIHYNGSIFSSGNWNTANKRWAFGVNQNNTKVDVLCNNYNTYLDCPVPVNEWTHLVCTCGSDRIIKLYKNGEYIGAVNREDNVFDSDYTWSAIGRESYASGYFSFNGAIQDFRLYNHCLSPMEVKELAQGLVLHYPLNRQGWGQENLMPNSVGMPVGSANPSTGTWRLAGSSQMTRSRVAIFDAPSGTSTYGFQSVGLQTGPDASCWGIDSFPRENGATYTLSAWGRIVGGSTTAAMLGFSIYSGTNLDYGGTYGQAKSSDVEYYGSGAYDYAGGKLNPNGSWTRIYRTFTSTATSGNIYIGFNTAKTGTNVTLQMCGVKLEKGDKMTPWIPNSNESMYTALGLNGTIEYDCSGFCNNGIKNNLPTYFSDTAKYEVSTHVNGVNQTIQLPNLLTLIPDSIFTFNIWFKRLSTEPGSKAWETLLGGPSGFEIETCSTNKVHDNKIKAYSWGGGTFDFELDEWNMLTMVSNGTNALFYLNGQLKLTGTYKALVSGNYFIGSWRDTSTQNYKGYLCDARIYSTALSADDILSLYKSNRL